MRALSNRIMTRSEVNVGHFHRMFYIERLLNIHPHMMHCYVYITYIYPTNIKYKQNMPTHTEVVSQESTLIETFPTLDLCLIPISLLAAPTKCIK